MTIVRGYWEVISPFRVSVAVALVLLFASGLLEGVALLALIPVMQGGLATQGTASAVEWLRFFGVGVRGPLVDSVLAFAALGFLSAVGRFGAESILLYLQAQIERHLRQRMNQGLLNMAWAQYIGLRLGDISTAALTEAHQIAFGARVFLNAAGTALVIIALGWAAVALSPQLTVYTALFGVVGLFFFRLTSRRVKRQAEVVASLASEIGDVTVTAYSNLKYVRATGLTGPILGGVEDRFRRFARAVFSSGFYGHLMRLALEIGAVVMVTLFILLTLRSEGGSTAKSLVFIFIFYRLAPRILTLQDNLHQCRTLLPWYTAWKHRLDLALTFPDAAEGTLRTRLQGGIRLDGITFTYPGGSAPVLRDVSMHLRQGECVAVVGPSGSGKSTLMDLVIGLLRADAGTVSVDGVALENLDLDSWRRGLGLVLQETPIFHASVLGNIAWGSTDLDPERAERAARMAQAWEFIAQLPEGMATVVGEKGSRLSGGQRQRIALARALYRDPDVLLLDEATSALDGAGEAEVRRALLQIKGSCTIFMITHRIQSVQFADRILVLGEGRVLEEGTWEQLLAVPDGHFKKMAEEQGISNS